MTRKKNEKAVIICTNLKGVFFGYTDDASGDVITLKRARMCIYWSEATKGVLGLGEGGPAKGSKIGPAVPSIELRGISCVIEPSSAAIARWESAPWG